MRRGSDRLWLRPVLTLSALLAVAVAAAVCGDVASAQGQLQLSDFNDAGLDVEFAALLEVGHADNGTWITFYSTEGAPVGTLLGGDLNLGPDDVAISTIRQATGDGDLQLRIVTGQMFNLGDYFNTGGAGNDLTLYLQDDPNTVESEALSIQAGGGLFLRLNLTTDAQNLLNGLTAGDRLVIAMARPLAPGQVTGVSSAQVTATGINVTWAPAEHADGYHIEWGTVSGTYTANADVATTSYSIGSLTPGTTYYFRVTATRSGAPDGPPSAEASATTLLSPPGQVSGVSSAQVTTTGIDVTWDPAQHADGYRIEWGTVSGTYAGNADVATTSYTIGSLTPGTIYYFRVTATREGAPDGTPSAEANATTLQSPPGQVTGVTAAANGYDRIDVAWSAAANADGYVVQWDDDAAFGTSDQATIPSGATVSYQITNLQEDTTYYVRAYATRSGAANGTVSAATSATTGLQPPAQVTGLSAVPASDMSVTLSWNPAVRAGAYRVEWGSASGSYTDSATFTSLSHTVSGLTNSTTYYFRVTATRSGAEDGPPSVEASAATLPPAAPGQVTGVSATAISEREIRVTWNAAANAMGYVVQWDADSSFSNPNQATTAGTGVVIEMLSGDTEYFIRVYATRPGAPDGPFSAADSATTLPSRYRERIRAFPGGPVAAQLGLAAFGGIMAGAAFRRDKSPQREVKIVGAMCLASLIMPALGLGGNLFWTGGIVILVGLAAVAVIWLSQRR